MQAQFTAKNKKAKRGPEKAKQVRFVPLTGGIAVRLRYKPGVLFRGEFPASARRQGRQGGLRLFPAVILAGGPWTSPLPWPRTPLRRIVCAAVPARAGFCFWVFCFRLRSISLSCSNYPESV
jgi:hypothetical protein